MSAKRKYFKNIENICNIFVNCDGLLVKLNTKLYDQT